MKAICLSFLILPLFVACPNPPTDDSSPAETVTVEWQPAIVCDGDNVNLLFTTSVPSRIRIYTEDEEELQDTDGLVPFYIFEIENMEESENYKVKVNNSDFYDYKDFLEPWDIDLEFINDEDDFSLNGEFLNPYRKLKKKDTTIPGAENSEDADETCYFDESYGWQGFTWNLGDKVSQRAVIVSITNPNEEQMSVRYDNGTTYNVAAGTTFSDFPIDAKASKITVRLEQAGEIKEDAPVEWSCAEKEEVPFSGDNFNSSDEARLYELANTAGKFAEIEFTVRCNE